MYTFSENIMLDIHMNQMIHMEYQALFSWQKSFFFTMSSATILNGAFKVKY